ncbi:MAG: recombinase family protein [Syntrophobacteraceae bacterium]|jgi:DNA invertase Pin-like site-specific DNA recombinase
MKTWAYLRISIAAKQDSDNQRLEIEEYCKANGLTVDDYLKIEISSRKTTKERRIDELLSRLNKGDTLIVSELSRLGRSVGELCQIVDSLIKKQVRLIAIKQGIVINGKHDIASKTMITMFALMAEIERDLISARTKNGLALARAKGKKLGNPNLPKDNLKRQANAQAFSDSLRHILEGFKKTGMTQRQIVTELNKLGIKARRGGQWSLIQVQTALKRLGLQKSQN